MDQRNGDGIRADITALKYGHNDVAELLDKLRASGWSSAALKSQLLVGSRPLARPQLRLLGHSGSGKSALAASLNAGLLHALFRRSTSLTARSRPSSPCQTSQIEMDVTPRHNSLSFEYCSTPNYVPTKGVQVLQMDLNGVGDITVWDFSGQESYFQIYHHFLSDVSIPRPSSIFSHLMAKKSVKKCNTSEVAKYVAANDNVITNIGKTQTESNMESLYSSSRTHCGSNIVYNRNKYAHINVYVIMFNLEKAYNVQLQQCIFWLNFVISRLSPCCTPGGLGNVILIGSHADTRAHKTAQGEYVYPAGDHLLQDIQQIFNKFFRIHPQVLALDCNASTSAGLRTLKTYLSFVKQSISQASVGNWSGFLEAALAWIVVLRKSIETFPVMSRQVFIENVRTHVNLLASDEHIFDAIHHLHIIGEILAVGQMVVLSGEWLCRVLGTLLGRGGLRSARALGVYTAHDFQAHFGYCDASQLLGLLQEMRLCTMCDVDDEFEYEFPCFNLVETLEGLWDPDDPRYVAADACYGGLKLCQARELTHMLTSIFPHIQVELRDDAESMRLSSFLDGCSGDCDLYQWWHGSKLCWGNIECILILSGPSGGEFYDLRIRGPPESGRICFIYSERVIQCINQTLGRVSPGLVLERQVLSAQQLRTHAEECYSWPSRALISELLESEANDNISFGTVTMTNPITNNKESLKSLLFFDSYAICETVEWAHQISVREMSGALLARLGALLDPPHSLGADWCMLAVSLGISQDSIAAFDSEMNVWHTTKLLQTVNCNIGTLIRKLESLGRPDAMELILRFAPLYLVTNYNKIDNSKSKENKTKTCISKDLNNTYNPNVGSKIHTDV